MISNIKKIFFFSATFLILVSFLMFSPKFSHAQQASEWECTRQDCEAPNKPREKAKNYEVEQDRKFDLEVKKSLAKDEKKFKRLGQQSENILKLDKKKSGNFGVWAFPNNGN